MSKLCFKDTNVTKCIKNVVALMVALCGLQFGAPRAYSEENFKFSAEMLAKHFTDLTMVFGVPEAEEGQNAETLAILRWAKRSLRMTFLAPSDGRLVKSASTSVGLIVGAVGDVLDIKRTPDMFADDGEISNAASADLLFIVAGNAEELATLREGSASFLKEDKENSIWLADQSAFGPGCGAAIAYEPNSKKIEKAILFINGTDLLGPNSSTLDRRVVDGLTFDCVNRQLFASIGLAKDWGRTVSVGDYSAFIGTGHAPLYDMAVATMLYSDVFEDRFSTSEKNLALNRIIGCLVEHHSPCAGK